MNKELLINVLVAILPATLAIVMLEALGLRGALVSLGTIILFTYLVGKIRKRHPKADNWLPMLRRGRSFRYMRDEKNKK